MLLLAWSGVLAAAANNVVLLWPEGAPGSREITEPEVSVDQGKNGVPDRHVSNVHKPSLLAYLPDPAQANGAAMVICPGGGFNLLALDKEGTEVARWLNTLGVAGFVLKYRLPHTKGYAYTVDTALADAQRAVRLIRSRAREWRVDPHRVGMMGFSAGAVLTAVAGTHFDAGDPAAPDPADHESSRPDLLVLAYFTYTDDIHITAGTPPAFLVHAGDDGHSAADSARFYIDLKRAGVPGELHIFTRGGHGFGIQNRSMPISGWPRLCRQWLADRGFLAPH